MTTLEILGPAPSKNGRRVRCRCECGKVFVAHRHHVSAGRTKSCGCASLAALRAGHAPRESVGLVHPFIPAQSVYVSDAALLGRAILALTGGPLTLPALAKACGVAEAELVERQGVLRGHVGALRFGQDVAYLHSHGLTTGWDALAPMRGGAKSEDRKAA